MNTAVTFKYFNLYARICFSK